MNTELTTVKSNQNIGEDFYCWVGTSIGCYNRGSKIYATDSIKSIVKNMLSVPYPPDQTTYDSSATVVGTINSVSDADNFFKLHNAANGWSGLRLGNAINIKYSSTKTVKWLIAGFNFESQYEGPYGIVDNGPGLTLIPETDIGITYSFEDDGSLYSGFYGSSVSIYLNTTVGENLYKYLGRHLDGKISPVSCHQDNTQKIPDQVCPLYQWVVLPSPVQLGGFSYTDDNWTNFGYPYNQLPLFAAGKSFATGHNYWTQKIYGMDGSTEKAYYCTSSGNIATAGMTTKYYLRPIIYVR